MSHELSIRSDGRAEFFAAGGPAWHGLGQVVEDAQTAESAIELAHLDWQVEQRPLHLPNGFTVPDRVANVRLDTETYLGTVSDKYEVIQNLEAFRFMDVLVGRGEAVFETAGAIKRGRKIFMTARLPGEIVVGPSDDRTKKYLLLMNTHDGSGALRCLFTPVRVVCSNTLNAALSSASQEDGISIRHTGDIDHKLEQAERVLGSAIRHYDQLAELFSRWRAERLSIRQAKDFFDQLVPEAPDDAGIKTRNRAERTRSELVDSFRRGPGADLAGRTLWGAVNAVVDWTDHRSFKRRPSATPESRLNHILYGSGRALKQKAFSLAASAVN